MIRKSRILVSLFLLVFVLALLTVNLATGLFAQDEEDPFASSGDSKASTSGSEAGDSGGDEFGGDSGSSDTSASVTSTPATGGEDQEPEKPYKPRDPSKNPKDPFKPLIVPQMPTAPPTKTTAAPAPKPTVQPLPIQVTCIVGPPGNKIAICLLNGQTHELAAGESAKDGSFTVKEIGENEIRVFDSRLNKERTIKLSTEGAGPDISSPAEIGGGGEEAPPPPPPDAPAAPPGEGGEGVN